MHVSLDVCDEIDEICVIGFLIPKILYPECYLILIIITHNHHHLGRTYGQNENIEYER